MDADKLIDSVKFLLKSVRQLSDRFVEANDNVARSFTGVREDVGDLIERTQKLEVELQNLRDRELIAVEGNRRALELPVRPDQLDLVIPQG